MPSYASSRGFLLCAAADAVSRGERRTYMWFATEHQIENFMSICVCVNYMYT